MLHYHQGLTAGGSPPPYLIKKLILAGGVCPFDQWFESLGGDDQAMVDTRLARVRLGAFGERRFVGAGVWELKFRKGRALRLYYGLCGKTAVLLIVGGDKRTQARDIEKARELFRSFKKSRS